MDQSIEQWRPVVGYEGCYEVSDCGRVRSVQRRASHCRGTRLVRSRILRQILHKSGYLQLTLYRDGVPKTWKVHHLVLTAFKGVCPEGLQCCHNDGDKTNNTILNLRWDTPRSNSEDKINHGVQPHGENHYSAKLTEVDALAIKADSRKAIAIARDYGVSPRQVLSIKRGDTWSHLPRESVPALCSKQGTNHPGAKLTEQIVLAIRADTRKQSEIAKAYGISRANVSAIKTRRSWSHL